MEIEIYVVSKKQYNIGGKLKLEELGESHRIFVKRDNKYYNPYIIEADLLVKKIQKAEDNIAILNEPRLFIVKELTKECVIGTILKIEKSFYFERLKECNVKDGIMYYELPEHDKEIYLKFGDRISSPVKELKMIYPLDETN